MRRLILALALGLLPAPSVQAQAQLQWERIDDRFEDAVAELRQLGRQVTAAVRELNAWEAELNARAGNGGTSIDQGDAQRAELSNMAVRLGVSGACIKLFRDARVTRYRLDAAPLVECAMAAPGPIIHLERLECGSLNWTSDASGQLRLSGIVGDAEERAAIIKKYGAANIGEITVRPPPVCGAVGALDVPMTSDAKPIVRMLHGQSEVRFGESLAFEIKTPDFFAFLYVIYLQSDGVVVNLMPRRTLMRPQQPPQSTLLFGDGNGDRQRFIAKAPTGPEAIIAIASRSPIDALDDLEDAEDGQYWMDANRSRRLSQAEFLDILRIAMDEEVEQGQGRREISAAIHHLTVIPCPNSVIPHGGLGL